METRKFSILILRIFSLQNIFILPVFQKKTI